MDRPLDKEQDIFEIPAYSPLEGRLSSTDAGYWFDPHYINCYPSFTKDQATGEIKTNVVKRPGTLTVNALTNTIASYGTATNMVCLANEVITQLYDVYVAAFFDSNTSKIYIIQYRPIAATTTKLGEIATANINDLIFITEITNGDTLIPAIAISYQKSDKSSGTGYYALTVAGVFPAASLTAIGSASFPANLGTPKIITGPFQYINGHNYIMTIDGFIYMSSLTAAGNPDITTWNTLATVVSSQYPDRGVGVYRYKQFLLAFGQDSVEFFADAGNPPPGSALERTDQLFIKFGAFSPKLIRNVDDAIYWLSYGSVMTTGMWRLGGNYQPEKLTTPREDYWIMNAGSAGGSHFTLEVLYLNQHLHIILNGYTTYTLAYASSVTTVSATSTDTYKVSISDLRAQIMAYSVKDGVWWGLNMCSSNDSSQDCYLMPTTAYPAFLTAGQYQQYVFKRSSSGTLNVAIGSTRPVTFYNNPTVGTYYDDVPEATTNKVLPVCVSMTFPTVWNANEKRKFMRSVNIICDQITKSGSDTNTYSLYLMWNKVGDAGSTAYTTVRDGIVTNTQVGVADLGRRYYQKSIGAYRQITFGLVYKDKNPFRLQRLQCESAQGTH